jgi:hypothetical protein
MTQFTVHNMETAPAASQGKLAEGLGLYSHSAWHARRKPRSAGSL